MYVPVEKCQYCGSDNGFYTKDYVSGSTRSYFNFDGTDADNGDYFEHLAVRSGKYAYCVNCDKRLFKITD